MNLLRKKKFTEIDTGGGLAKCLTSWDLLLLGIGAIVGAGVFVLTGIAAATSAGPAIILSYVLAGAACAFSALAYAELAAAIGGCGSAYGYSYAGFGELAAWIVGWDLLLEYAISVSAVSVGWSGYFNDLLHALHVYLPDHLLKAPSEGGFCNILAVGIIAVLAVLLILGVRLSAWVNNAIVFVKLGVILIFIVLAYRNFHIQNWFPFMPYGWHGMVEGAALIFFAYIGFDAVSTAAEEAIDPQRSLPIGILGSLVICTVLYMLVAGLLTGIVSYTALNVPSPISHAMLSLGYRFAAALIGLGAIAGLTTVMLAFFYGLTRIFFAMSRDGLLPQYFNYVNTVTKTPIRIILLSGVIMMAMSGLVPMHDLTELVNVGTLFAFILVCGGVLVLHYKEPGLERPFKTPFMPWVPILGVLSCLYLLVYLPWITLLRFIIWMLAGLIIYALYSYHHSALNSVLESQNE